MSARTPVPASAPDALPLIETKLALGRLLPERLIRQRLLAELDRCSTAALTLIDAPVGFGKTVLAQTWCAHTDAAVAWVSLDAGDNDPVRFWTYVATSVDRIRPGLGRMALARLRTPGVPVSVAVDELVNGLASYDAPLAIVLDDLHLVGNEECLSSLEHAVEHLPAQATIVATTRSDPALPLGRLRARGALGEIRAADLAFRFDEARELLVGRERIALDDEDVALLVERTEGWPAGLYLAALWLREAARSEGGRAGVPRQPPPRRRLPLGRGARRARRRDAPVPARDVGARRASRRSSATRRSAARTRPSGCAELERTNRFLVPLDAHGEWYRYHHLFRELLQLELTSVDPAAAGAIHVRAAAWCHEHGLIEEALDHAADAGDQRVGRRRCSARSTSGCCAPGQVATLLRWGAKLPEEVLVERPELPTSMALAAGLRDGPTLERRRYVTLAERSRTELPERWTGYHEALFALARLNWVEHDLGASIELARATVQLGQERRRRRGRARAHRSRLSAAAAGRAARGARARGGGARAARGSAPSARARHGVRGAGARRRRGERARRRRRGCAGGTRRGRRRRVSRRSPRAGSHGSRSPSRSSAGAGSATPSARRRYAERIRRSPYPSSGISTRCSCSRTCTRAAASSSAPRPSSSRPGRACESFADAGRLPALADAVAATIERGRAAADPSPSRRAPPSSSVLRLLATELSQREIGAELYLSLNTVKTHTRSLYRKLGVASREEAVARAHALGLLDSDSPG